MGTINTTTPEELKRGDRFVHDGHEVEVTSVKQARFDYIGLDIVEAMGAVKEIYIRRGERLELR